MTTPINSDKHPSLTTAHSPTGQAGKAPEDQRPHAGDKVKPSETSPVAGGENIDVARANQMLELTNGSLIRRPGGSIENGDQAKAALSRLEALVKEDPDDALRAHASGLNDLHRALLEAQPT